jgi:hypothetical protein
MATEETEATEATEATPAGEVDLQPEQSDVPAGISLATEPDLPPAPEPLPDITGEKLEVNKAAFYKIYNALLKDKAQFYVGRSAKRVLSQCLGLSGEELAAKHEEIRKYF